MARYTLNPYRIKVKLRNTDRNLDLNNISTNAGNKTLYEILIDFFNQYTNSPYSNTDWRKTFHIEDIHTRNNQLIFGTIKSGEYGYSGDFYNIENDELTQNARTEYDSEELPFFFMVNTSLPQRNTDTAILLLQKFKNFGTKSILQNSIREYFRGLGEFVLKINPIISTDLMRELESVDRVVKLRLIKREVPRDVAEVHKIENFDDIAEERVFKIKGKREYDSIQFMDNLRHNRIVDELRNIEYPYVEVDEEYYDEIKIETKTQGSTKTLILGENSQFREKLVIRENRIELENGHPTLDSISNIGVDYMNHILEQHTEQPITLVEGDHDSD